MEGCTHRAHADRILDRALARAPSGTRQESRPADARCGVGGGRRHGDFPRETRACEVRFRRPGLRRHRDRVRPRLSLEGVDEGRAQSSPLPVTRFPLRAKLALVALVLLVLPWAGWLYV